MFPFRRPPRIHLQLNQYAFALCRSQAQLPGFKNSEDTERQSRTLFSTSHRSSNHGRFSSEDRKEFLNTFSCANFLRSEFGSKSSEKRSPKKLDELVVPVSLESILKRKRFIQSHSEDVGNEMVGPLTDIAISNVLSNFARRPGIRKSAEENGITDRLFHQAFTSFRRFCIEGKPLKPELHIILSDIVSGEGHVDDIFPYFVQHARTIFPHLECIEELKKISDLTEPANWYPEARNLSTGRRKIVFHAGPTNSGKTHQAMLRFLSADSGVYCGPLKLLASEIYHRTNAGGVPCDLITGEDRRFAKDDHTESSHVSCTVEMLSTHRIFQVAVIDEIQMMRDRQRGWAWTRALLGVCAEEVHVCGEGAAIDLVKELVEPLEENVEVRTYQRMTPLRILDQPLTSIENVKPGDCIVCFSKNDIYTVSREVERCGHEVAVIYGSLPPNTKLAQAKKFNDPEDKCKVMVATDAIGMGLNLSIKRIIFYSMTKPQVGEDGDKTREVLSTSQALQIAGRAGRYGTNFDVGEVTAFRSDDLATLKQLLREPVESIEQAGLHPTLEQIEMFSLFLPNATLTNLLDIFLTLCLVDDSRYFVCPFEDLRFLAECIVDIPLSLKVQYTFCLVPVNRQHQKVLIMFLKFARRFSRNEPLTFDWLCEQLNWPLDMPQTINDLVDLEGVFDVTDMYLWLGYRFIDMFPDMDSVRGMQADLELMIQEGVSNIVKLLKSMEKTPTNSVSRRRRSTSLDAKEGSIKLNDFKQLSDSKHTQADGKEEDATCAGMKLEEILSHQHSFIRSAKRKGATGLNIHKLLYEKILQKGTKDFSSELNALLEKELGITANKNKSAGKKKDRRRK